MHISYHVGDRPAGYRTSQSCDAIAVYRIIRDGGTINSKSFETIAVVVVAGSLGGIIARVFALFDYINSVVNG